MADSNFGIYARYRDKSRWSDEMQITSHPGPDISPAAATDADGTIWITWPGYRESFDALVARQEEDGFSAEQAVSSPSASDWARQIAAARSSGVAISWDTYDNAG